MTDKQIIIDGVDVSWCEHYKHNDKNSGWSSCTSKDEEHIHAVNPLCCEKKDCLYKQLKRKEQECERFKKQLTILDDETIVVEITEKQFEEYQKLKAENENFKSLIYWLHYGAIDAERIINEYYENRNTPYEENFWKRIRALQPCKYESKYKTALTEIKEIAEKIDDRDGCAYGDYDCDNCSSLEQETVCTYKVKKLILQKISECEGNDE